MPVTCTVPTVLQGRDSSKSSSQQTPSDIVAPGAVAARPASPSQGPPQPRIPLPLLAPPALQQRPERLLHCPQPGHAPRTPSGTACAIAARCQQGQCRDSPVPWPAPSPVGRAGPLTARRQEQVPVAILGNVVKMPLLLLIMSLLFKCIHWSCASPLRQEEPARGVLPAHPPAPHLHSHLHTCPRSCPHPALDRAALGPLRVRQSEGLRALGLVLVILDMNSIKT